ncbi:hypothetical protein WN944_015175 [Citrus x changshan-huyou]|uniref:Uncharacterized protein n=1 Tax=Citrus x changshan-huyou TaxID=2935761 RepID=A0AAP0M6Z8_9ROSI
MSRVNKNMRALNKCNHRLSRKGYIGLMKEIELDNLGKSVVKKRKWMSGQRNEHPKVSTLRKKEEVQKKEETLKNKTTAIPMKPKMMTVKMTVKEMHIRKNPRPNPSIQKDYANDERKIVESSNKQLDFDCVDGTIDGPMRNTRSAIFKHQNSDLMLQLFEKLCEKYLPDENDGVLTYMIDDNVFQRHACAYIGKKDCNELLSMEALGVNFIQDVGFHHSTNQKMNKTIWIHVSKFDVFDVVKKKVFYVDPVQSSPDTDLEQLLKITMTLFATEDSKKKWNYNSKMRIVKALKRNIIKLQCGYYVLRYMKVNGKKVNTQDELNEVRLEWANHFSDILVASAKWLIGLLGLGWSVARYVAGIPVVWKDTELEDVGLLLNVCWESCWVSGYWNIVVRRCITVEGFVGLVVGI